ncbi:MAG: hypothetical protein PVG03_11495 [Desulfarculaceae bacterium]|jgi:hypothetical protein
MPYRRQQAIREIIATLVCSDLYFALDPAARLELVRHHLTRERQRAKKDQVSYH